MQYLLMIYGNEAGMLAASKEQVGQMSAAYAAYTQAMQKAGVIRGGERLRPTSEATTVRVNGGKTQVLDGPYADTKEQFAGYFFVDVPSVDEAIVWAKRCPSAPTESAYVSSRRSQWRACSSASGWASWACSRRMAFR